MTLQRHLSLLAAVAATVILALPGLAQAPARASLAGQFLIASPVLNDSNFARTVVLMVQHDVRGALGIVINRPLGERPLARLLAAFGEKDAAVTGNVQIFSGGPVQAELGFVIHSDEYARPETVAIGSGLAMTASRDILRDIGAGKGPKQMLVALGYAGWAPGQLESEMMRQAWFTAPADARLVFEETREKVWDKAMERRGVDL